MLIDIHDDNTNTIYYNNDAHDFSDYSHNPSRNFREDDIDNNLDSDQWSVYPFKPVAQTSWDDLVKTACVAAAKVDVPDPALTPDLRPRVYDHNAKMWLLLDTGAAISCYPRSAFPNAKPDPTRLLQAVNGAKVETYGSRQVKIDLGGRTYTHTFVLASITEPILGFDFVLKFKVDLVWQSNKKCHLADKRANREFPLYLQKAHANNVGLSLITFKKYSEQQKIINNEEESTDPVPPLYQHLIDAHKGILQVNFAEVPKHNVIHTIDTGTNKPCRARPRPLMVGSPKYESGK